MLCPLVNRAKCSSLPLQVKYELVMNVRILCCVRKICGGCPVGYLNTVPLLYLKVSEINFRLTQNPRFYHSNLLLLGSKILCFKLYTRGTKDSRQKENKTAFGFDLDLDLQNDTKHCSI